MRKKQMKKFILTGIAATLVSTSALASQARLLALGMKETDNEGLYYVNDSRNIFQNPAWAQVYSNTVIAEYGEAGSSLSGSGTSVTLDKNEKPKAQGGVFQKIGDLTYGVYFGNESNTSALLRIVGTSALTAGNGTITAAGVSSSKQLQSADNQVDFFVAGDRDGVKWGVNALYAGGKRDANKSKDSAAAIRGGVLAEKWDAHLNLSLASKSEATDDVTGVATGDLNGDGDTSDTGEGTAVSGAVAGVKHEFKGKLGLQVGGSYLATDSLRVFGYMKHFAWEQTDGAALITAQRNVLGGQQGTVKGDFNSYYVGTTHTHKISETDTVFATVHVKKTDVNLKFTNKGEVRHMVVPVTLAYEAKATEWLTLRGSVMQNIYGVRDNKNLNNLNVVARGAIKSIYGDNGKSTLPNTTEVNAGATLTFGNLAVDGVIGATNASRTGGLAASGTNTGTLTLDNLMSRVGMTYKF